MDDWGECARVVVLDGDATPSKDHSCFLARRRSSLLLKSGWKCNRVKHDFRHCDEKRPGKGHIDTGPLMSVEIPVERLKASLSDLVAKLRAATIELAAKADGLSLKELEVGIEVTAEGGVSLIGSAKAGGTASLKLTVVRDL